MRPRPSPFQLILLCGSLVLALSLGIRHGFGLFLTPMSLENGWGREVFAWSIALQNLIWGISQPFVGMAADRLGALRVALVGGLLYAIGLFFMAQADTSLALSLSAGLLIGLGLSGTSFSVVLGAVGRAAPPERRSQAMGIAAAAGSFGQFSMLPIETMLLAWTDWHFTLLLLSGFAALMIPLAFGLREETNGPKIPEGPNPGAAFMQAAQTRDFWLLCFGYFVCGFQVVFIGVHLPSYLADEGLGPEVASLTLALVGLFNIAGTYYAGQFGARMAKPRLLTAIYLTRAVVISAFLIAPLTEFGVYVFGIAMGLLWLSTVPLTNGTVATLFGVKNLAMLGGFVFSFHQVGSFLGAWLGGRLYDATGSYEWVWLICIGLGVIAGALNWPVRETPRSLGPRLEAAAE